MSRGYYILDSDNRPVKVDPIEWARWWDRNDRTVGMTQITSQVMVSTVFMGLDHRFDDTGRPPLLFETMIFGGPLDEQQWRYASWDDAETGHAAAVRMARVAQGQKITQSEDC